MLEHKYTHKTYQEGYIQNLTITNLIISAWDLIN